MGAGVGGDAAIEIEGLVVNYGRRRAMEGLSLTVPRGAVYGFLGPNGAGKTSTIKTLMGFRKPDGGSARVLGYDVVKESLEVRARVGFASEVNSLYWGMTVPRICRLCRDLSRSWNQDLVDRYIGVVALVSTLVFRDVLRSLLATVAAMFVILAGPDLLRALLQWIVYGDRFYTMDWATLPRWYRAFDHLRLYDYWIGMQTFSGEAIFARSVVVCTITAAATLLLALWLFRRKAY